MRFLQQLLLAPGDTLTRCELDLIHFLRCESNRRFIDRWRFFQNNLLFFWWMWTVLIWQTTWTGSETTSRQKDGPAAGSEPGGSFRCTPAGGAAREKPGSLWEDWAAPPPPAAAETLWIDPRWLHPSDRPPDPASLHLEKQQSNQRAAASCAIFFSDLWRQTGRKTLRK